MEERTDHPEGADVQELTRRDAGASVSAALSQPCNLPCNGGTCGLMKMSSLCELSW